MNESLLPFEVEAVVFCDDIRKEANGKELLIGVYNGIRVERFPAQLGLSIWIQYAPKTPGIVQARFRLIGDHGEEFFNAVGKLNVQNVELSSTSIPPLFVAMQIPGNLTLQLQLKNQEWLTLKQLSVQTVAASAPSAQQAPKP